MKKSFVLYTDAYETIKHLPDEQLGQLTRMIYEYVREREPITPEHALFFVFNPIKLQLDRDFETYEGVRVKRSEAGKNSANKRNKRQQVLTPVNKSEQTLTNPTDNVNVNVNDNVKRKRAKPVYTPIEQKVYFNNAEINQLFIDFLNTRTQNKQPVTERGVEILVNRAKKIYKSPAEFKAALEDSIANNWKTFYEPKVDFKKEQAPVTETSRAWNTRTKQN